LSKLIEISYPITNWEEVCALVAPQLGATWQNNYYDIPPSLGEGRVEAYNFRNFSIMLARFKLKENILVHRIYSPLQDYLEFSYVMNGISQQFKNQFDAQITQLSHGCHIATPATASSGQFEKGIFHQHYDITINKTWLELFLEKPLPSILQNPNTPLFIHVHLSRALLPSLTALAESKSDAPLRKQYLYSKSLEIVMATLASFISHQNQYAHQQRAHHPEDIATIQQLAVYIQQNLSASITIEQLSHQYGINRTKLQALFKSIYGQTIAEYVRHLRMTKAYFLITERRSIAEVGTQMGYANLSHFSAAFKKVHGINPSEVVK